MMHHIRTKPRTKIGVVTSGTFIKGLTARLEAGVEDMRVGKFVIIEGEKHQFFSMVTDVALEATNQKVLIDPPDGDIFIHEVLSGTSTYGTISLIPRLMLPSSPGEELQPVKTVPRHFSPLYDADEEDFTKVFGQQDGKPFEIGKPLDMDVPVCIKLDRFVERSNGIFGKSGTGKSFLTRLLLSGSIYTNAASNLIFDMHNEYGWDSTSETGNAVKGLRQLFGSKVRVYTLDPESSRRRGNAGIDGQVVIGLNQIEVEDVIPMQDELNLSSAAAESSYMLAEHYKEAWLSRLLEMEMDDLREFADSSGAHLGAISALKRKLGQLKRLAFVQNHVEGFSVVDGMIDALANGQHVVLEFGRHDNALSYMLVANAITRRIHRRWKEQTEVYQNTKNEADRPRQLMITIEEAHKFLNPTTAKQTIFGTIAREMRKYSVTLLVVDQRPSSIDDEVMSQLGTRVTALLNDEKDIEAVFAGVSGSSGLKAVLATLDTRQQALVLGHAVPMAVVVRTRPYDHVFYRSLTEVSASARKVENNMEELFS
jgi:DNA helicase HerA-like ATPase